MKQEIEITHEIGCGIMGFIVISILSVSMMVSSCADKIAAAIEKQKTVQEAGK